MLKAGGRCRQYTGVLSFLAPCAQHLFLGQRTLTDVYIDVFAELPKLLQILGVADLEALEKEGCLEPRAIELGHVHATLQVGSLDLESLGLHS